MNERLEKIISKYTHTNRENLIPILQDAQEEFGYLPEDIIVLIGKRLDIPTSKIYGLATFYDQFKFKKNGKYHFKICQGTACFIIGGRSILEQLEKYLQIKTNETSRDGLFSLEVVDCIGACALSPVLSVNNEYYHTVNTESIRQIIESLKQKD